MGTSVEAEPSLPSSIIVTLIPHRWAQGVSRKIRITKEHFFIVFRETMYIMLGNLIVEATWLFYVPSIIVGEDGPDSLFA